jgi:hypothetical protein
MGYIAILNVVAAGGSGPLAIFWRFVGDTLLTGGIYVLLVVATLVIRYSAKFVKGSKLHEFVLTALEYAIFISGSLTVLVVLVCVTSNTIVELISASHFNASRAQEQSGSHGGRSNVTAPASKPATK